MKTKRRPQVSDFGSVFVIFLRAGRRPTKKVKAIKTDFILTASGNNRFYPQSFMA